MACVYIWILNHFFLLKTFLLVLDFNKHCTDRIMKKGAMWNSEYRMTCSSILLYYVVIQYERPLIRLISYPIVKISPMPSCKLLIWAKNKSATLRYRAEPSMLIVPIGRTNFVIFEFIFSFSSNTLNVIGSDADLKSNVNY